MGYNCVRCKTLAGNLEMRVLLILRRRFGGAVLQRENIPAPPVLRLVQETCPWLPEEGTGSLTTWGKIRKKLRDTGLNNQVYSHFHLEFLESYTWIHDCFFKGGQALQSRICRARETN